MTPTQIIISTVYILYFRSVNSNERSTAGATIAVLALSLTLITSALVPVDVFLVSYMKFSNGTYKPWAEVSFCAKKELLVHNWCPFFI